MPGIRRRPIQDEGDARKPSKQFGLERRVGVCGQKPTLRSLPNTVKSLDRRPTRMPECTVFSAPREIVGVERVDALVSCAACAGRLPRSVPPTMFSSLSVRTHLGARAQL